MTSSTETRLTPGQRLARGLAHSAAGPVDVTRGALGLGANAIVVTAAGLRQRYREGKLRRELERELVEARQSVSRELTAAKDALAELPESFRAARADRHRSRRPWIIAGAAAAALALGGAAFAVVRRNSRPEPSPLPPSVQVEPKP